MTFPAVENSQELPLDMMGGCVFGRYPIISSQEIWNMIVSDNWAVPFSGYEFNQRLSYNGYGRKAFHSPNLDSIIAVVYNIVFIIKAGTPSIIGHLATFNGYVFIDENNAKQIAICDLQDIWIYDYSVSVMHPVPTFTKATLDGVQPLDFKPGYIAYQDTYFITVDLNSSAWYISQSGNGLLWPRDAQHQGALQTKPDKCQAAVRVPGKGNMLFVFGKTVVEQWYDAGLPLFPYQRSNTVNVDYGCLNSSTIAATNEMVCWLGSNGNSGPVIMYSTGGEINQISTDGINYLFGALNNPENAYGFMVRQDGHLLYQLTFPDPSDNFTLVYDFNTSKFFFVSNENQEAHIAINVVFQDGDYFFVSRIDGNLYRQSSDLYTYKYIDNEFEIPRIIIPKTVRLPDSSRFCVNSISFMIEQGTDQSTKVPDLPINPRVDLTVSTDGGETFSSGVQSQLLNPIGYRPNRMIWYQLGSYNDCVFQFRFYSYWRFVISEAQVVVYQ